MNPDDFRKKHGKTYVETEFWNIIFDTFCPDELDYWAKISRELNDE